MTLSHPLKCKLTPILLLTGAASSPLGRRLSPSESVILIDINMKRMTVREPRRNKLRGNREIFPMIFSSYYSQSENKKFCETKYFR